MATSDTIYGLTLNTEAVLYANKRPHIVDPVDDYLEASKIYRDLAALDMPGLALMDSIPELAESTTRAARSAEHLPKVALPQVRSRSMTLEAAITGRRSDVEFVEGESFTLEDLSYWCWAAAGESGSTNHMFSTRTFPSGGALYPSDLYLAVQTGPNGLHGTYYYSPKDHSLYKLNGTLPQDFGDSTSFPSSFDNGEIVWIIASSLLRSRVKYADRSLRFGLLEAGHLMQNLLLAVQTTHSRGTRPVGGFYDDEVSDLLGLDGINEFPVYMAVSGRVDTSR